MTPRDPKTPPTPRPLPELADLLAVPPANEPMISPPSTEFDKRARSSYTHFRK